MRKSILMMMAVLFATFACARTHNGQDASRPAASLETGLPKVYWYKTISSENLIKIYEALGREASGKVAVKLSTGEPGGHNFLQPALIKDLVQKVNGTIVECNTAYGGGRSNTESHLKAAADHGFTAIAPVDIMDAEGETDLPVKGGKHPDSRHRRQRSVELRFHHHPFPFQRTCNGRVWWSHQEHVHRHSVLQWQAADPFRRNEHDKLGPSCPGRFPGVNG